MAGRRPSCGQKSLRKKCCSHKTHILQRHYSTVSFGLCQHAFLEGKPAFRAKISELLYPFGKPTSIPASIALLFIRRVSARSRSTERPHHSHPPRTRPTSRPALNLRPHKIPTATLRPTTSGCQPPSLTRLPQCQQARSSGAYYQRR